MVSRWVPDRMDVIWIEFDPQAGREMKSRHPMLVLSPRAFNDRTSLVIGLPMSSQSYNADNPFAIAVSGDEGEVGYVLCHQPKSFDWRERRAKPHPWKLLPAGVVQQACESLNQIIALA